MYSIALMTGPYLYNIALITGPYLYDIAGVEWLLLPVGAGSLSPHGQV